jgi:hypothetical protein
MKTALKVDQPNLKKFDRVKSIPVIKTKEVSNIKYHAATCGGEIVSTGVSSDFTYGICWAMHANPTVYDLKIENHINLPISIRVFTCDITNLDPGTMYYVRAFAKNNWGIGYGVERTLITKSR